MVKGNSIDISILFAVLEVYLILLGLLLEVDIDFLVALLATGSFLSVVTTNVCFSGGPSENAIGGECVRI